MGNTELKAYYSFTDGTLLLKKESKDLFLTEEETDQLIEYLLTNKDFKEENWEALKGKVTVIRN